MCREEREKIAVCGLALRAQHAANTSITILKSKAWHDGTRHGCTTVPLPSMIHCRESRPRHNVQFVLACDILVEARKVSAIMCSGGNS